MLNPNTMRIRISAAPQPKEWADSYGCDARRQILKGKASTGEVKPVKNRLVPRMLSISGAVSPAILDIASTTPVKTPLFALSRTMKSVTFHFGMPSECPASLIEFGTIFKVSSVTLTTIGIMMIDSENAPAQTEKEPMVRTIATYPTIPMTIEGSPVITSLKNLTKYANLLLPAYSERYMPASMPTGAPMADARPITISVP